jgi:hypothetical protein
MLDSKNLFANSLFWGVAAALILNVVPAVQRVRYEKQLPIDAVLTILMSLGVSITTVNNLYSSSGTVYYTNKQLPGRNKEDVDALMDKLNSQEPQDGNF